MSVAFESEEETTKNNLSLQFDDDSELDNIFEKKFLSVSLDVVSEGRISESSFASKEVMSILGIVEGEYDKVCENCCFYH
jgi:hypothetical protein